MMSLLVLVVLGGMLAAASPMIVNEVKMNTVNRDMIDAQFAAEAGAKVGIAAVYAKKTSSELDWLGKQQNLTNSDSTRKYTVTISPEIRVSGPISGTTYTITSIGKVNNSTTRQVVVKVTTPAGTEVSGVFSNASFSVGNVTVNGGTINGNVSTNGTYTNWNRSTNVLGDLNAQYFEGRKSSVSGSTKCQSGKAYCDSEDNTTGTLDVASYMKTAPVAPTMPTFTKSGTLITTRPTGTLPSGNYYSDSSFAMPNGRRYTITSGDSVFIFITGNFQMDEISSIDGGNITIYATGNITMNRNTFVRAATTGSVSIYAEGSIQLNTNSFIAGKAIVIQAKDTVTLNSGTSVQAPAGGSVAIYSGKAMQLNSSSISGETIKLQSAQSMTLNSGTSIQATSGGSVSLYSAGAFQMNNALVVAKEVEVISNGTLTLNSGSSINKNSAESVAKLYSLGTAEVNGATIGGTGLIVSTSFNALNLNSNSQLSTTVVMASGPININGASVAGVYSASSITVNSGSTVTYSESVVKTLGLASATGSGTFKIESWSKQ